MSTAIEVPQAILVPSPGLSGRHQQRRRLRRRRPGRGGAGGGCVLQAAAARRPEESILTRDRGLTSRRVRGDSRGADREAMDEKVSSTILEDRLKAEQAFVAAPRRTSPRIGSLKSTVARILQIETRRPGCRQVRARRSSRARPGSAASWAACTGHPHRGGQARSSGSSMPQSPIPKRSLILEAIVHPESGA